MLTKRLTILLLFFVPAFIMPAFAMSDETVPCIKFVAADVLKRDPNNGYFVKVLEQALEMSEDSHGAYQLCPLNTLITQKRQLLELDKGKVDVFWTMTTKAREKEAIAIPIPLAFGVYGLRVLVVNQAAINMSPETLLKRPMLIGADWPDRTIFESNGMIVDAGHSEHDLLFLTADRDLYAFPRGITEAWAELATVSLEDLAVDEHWLIQYPAVMYFFVSHNKPELAKRIKQGLETMLTNGQLEDLFFSFPWHQEMMRVARLQDRKIITFNNPTLPSNINLEQVKEMQDMVIKGQPQYAQ